LAAMTTTPTSATTASGSGVAASPRSFHVMDPSTVALLGDRKRYRVDVDAKKAAASTSGRGRPKDTDRKEAAGVAPTRTIASSPKNASYTIRIVHELTGCVGRTIPVATLVARQDVAGDPEHQATTTTADCPRACGGSSSTATSPVATTAGSGGRPFPSPFQVGSRKTHLSTNPDLCRSDAGRLV
jgi:hypothetical protein